MDLHATPQIHRLTVKFYFLHRHIVFLARASQLAAAPRSFKRCTKKKREGRLGRREEHEEGGVSASSFERSSKTAHAKRAR